MGAFARIPPWIMLPCLAVSLAAAGAVIFGAAEVSAARAAMIQQVDDGLLACASGVVDGRSPLVPGYLPSCGQPPSGTGVRYDVELLAAGGTVLFPEAAGGTGSAAGPVLPASAGWLAAHPARYRSPVTVPGGGSGGWRVLIEAVRYQGQRMLFVDDSQDMKFTLGPGSGGLLVVTAGLADVGRVTARIAAGFAAGACAVLVLLAGAGLTLARAMLRQPRVAASDGCPRSPGDEAAPGPDLLEGPGGRRARRRRGDVRQVGRAGPGGVAADISPSDGGWGS